MGIAIMMAMVEDPGNSSLAPVIVHQYLEDGVNPETIISNLANLCSSLLVIQRNVTGIAPADTLRMIAQAVNTERSDG